MDFQSLRIRQEIDATMDAKMDDALKVPKSIEAIKADRKAIDEAAQACAAQIRERLQTLVTLP